MFTKQLFQNQFQIVNLCISSFSVKRSAGYNVTTVGGDD